MAIDIETRGPEITRLGVSDGGGTWTAGFNHVSRHVLRETIGAADRLSGQEVVARPRIIGHNLVFDASHLKREGLDLSDHPWFDTMIAAHMIQPDLYKGLGRVAPLYLDCKMWKHKSEEEPERYNATDVKLTWEIAQRQEEILERTGMARLFHGTIMKALPVLMRLTERGIHVSKERLVEWTASLSSRQRHEVDIWRRLAGEVNPLSPPQVRKLLYKELNLAPQTGKSGKETVDESALVTLRDAYPEHHDLIACLLRLRQVMKLRGTYAEVEMSQDGCVHPSYLPAGKESDAGAAATGRLAASNPNIQNQPAEARCIFVPHRSGWRFVEADYSQIELRAACALSGDRALAEALKGDVHAATQRLLGCDRVRAKNVIYGSLYGAGPRKLNKLLHARGVRTSEAECRALQERLARAYPALWDWRTAVVAEGTAQRYLVNPFGRRRYFYGGSRDAPQMIDYLPQSIAADILWDRLLPLETWAESNGGHLVTTVHDSVLLEFPEETINDCLISNLRRVLEHEFDQVAPSFRVPVDIKVGETWGTMTPLEPVASG